MKICVIQGNKGLVESMYVKRGFQITESVHEADLVQFTGGEDVNPGLYGETKHPSSTINPIRDKAEEIVYRACLAEGIPMVGICRGGQFLNVMNGGKMYQHVDGHTRYHDMIDSAQSKRIYVSSTHHQMMRPHSRGTVVAYADGISHKKERMEGGVVITNVSDREDTEVVYYEDTSCLCFQPHPEYGSVEKCTDYFFELLDTLLGVK